MSLKLFEEFLAKNRDYSSFIEFVRVLLGNLNNDSDEGMARKAILTSLTYRLPQSAKKDRFIGFRELKRVLFNVNKTLPQWAGDHYIFDTSQKSCTLRTEYLGRMGYLDSHFIARNELICYRKSINRPIRWMAFLLGVKWSIECLFSNYRVNKALLYRSLLEFMCFVKIIQSNSRISIFDFNQYELDSNLFYVALKQLFGSELKYYKFPSPGPLSLHNSILLTDTLCYNTPYHLEEIKHLEKSIRYSELKRVPVELFFTFESHYNKSESFQFKYELGYYSHASWLRKASDHADDGLNIFEFEQKLLKHLNQLLQLNPLLRISIYTHPRERVPELIEKTKEYYKQFLKNDDRVTFCDINARSSHEFKHVKLGIGVYSTILFERLACGFPTLIMSPIDGFPIPNSALSNIVINEVGFQEKVQRDLKLDTKEFFEKYELNEFVDPLLKSEE